MGAPDADLPRTHPNETRGFAGDPDAPDVEMSRSGGAPRARATNPPCACAQEWADGLVLSHDDGRKEWRTGGDVELTRKTEARVSAMLRHLLARYDDVVYRVHPSAMTVVTRSDRPQDRVGADHDPALPAAGVGRSRLTTRRGGSPR